MGCLYLYYFNSAHSELLGAKKMPKSVSQTRMWKLDDIYANKNPEVSHLKRHDIGLFVESPWIPTGMTLVSPWVFLTSIPLGESTTSTVPWGPRCESNWRRKRTWNRRRCGKSCPGRLEKMAMLWLFWMGKNAIISSCLRKMVVENCGIPSVHRGPAMGGSKLTFQCLHWLFSGSSC